MARAFLLSALVLVALGGLAAIVGLFGPRNGSTDPTGGVALNPTGPLGGGVTSGPIVQTRAELQGPDRVSNEAEVIGDVRTDVVYPLRVELSLVSRASLPRDEGSPAYRAGAVAGIEGTLTGLDGEPASGATVEFTSGPNRGRVLTADSRGRYGATDLWEGLSLIVVRANGLISERPVRLRRLMRTPLSVDFSAPVWIGASVRGATGEAIEGAEIWIDGKSQLTDVEGRAMFQGVSVGKVMTRVHKPGFARIERELILGRGAFVEADQNVYTLRPGASLSVHVDFAGTTGVPCQLHILPAGGSGGPGGSTLREFPWHAVSPIEVPVGRTVTIDDLPEDVVQLRPFYPGARAEPAASHVRLHAGTPTSVALNFTSAPTLIGKVLREGVPAAGVRVVLEAPNRDYITAASFDKDPTYAEEIVLHHSPAAFQETKTDGRGSFVLTAFDGLTEGRYLTAETDDGRWHAMRLVRDVAADIVLELQPVPERGGELVLELPGRFQGLPVEVQVDGQSRDPDVLRPGVELTIGDLQLGTWRVHAIWERVNVISRRDVVIGEEGVRLLGTLPEGALIGQSADVRRRVLGE